LPQSSEESETLRDSESGFAAEAAGRTEGTVEKTGRLVYIGPNIPGGALQTHQVFRGGLPPWCDPLFRQVPEIRDLFVPVGDLARAMARVKEPGTNEFRLFSFVQSATRG
jgi:hypothetical protein